MGHKVIGLLDSGAQVSVAGAGFAPLLAVLNIEPTLTSTSIKTADSTNHEVFKCVNLPINFNGLSKTHKTLLVPSIPSTLILGMDFWCSFQIKPSIINTIEEIEKTIQVSVDHSLNQEQAKKLQKVLKLMPFSTDSILSKTHLVSHNINTGDAKPIKQRHYVVSPYVQLEIDKEIDRLLKLGVIEHCPSSPWCNPVVAVKKPNGKIRVCLDARKLNNVTVKDTYPQQNINRILGRLAATKFLSSIDFSDAFLQIPLDKESQPKTAFAISGRGLFSYTRMPFGLCNSGATLCRLVDEVVGCDLEPKVFVYLDDIIIATETLEDHVEVLRKLAGRLKDAGLTISIEKSKFCAKRLCYLGYIVTEEGLKPDPEKVIAMSNYPSPKSVKDVRRLLGLAGWYRRFIKDFSEITAPLSNLLKKNNNNKKFNWNEEANMSFEKLKTALTSEPVLTCPDYSQPFTIQCDASDQGIGGVLVQGDGPNEKIIAYMSEKLSSAQRKYQTTERECLAVIRSIEKFRPYIEGVKFKVISDHASLQWLMNLKDPSGRVGRWALRLQAYDFTLEHRKGKFMVVPDALSRAIVEITHSPSNEVINEWYTNLGRRIAEAPSRYPQFRIQNDVIYKYCSHGSTANGFMPSWRIVVKESDKKAILKKFHDEPLSAHQGYFKTLNKIKLEYYWPNMSSEIKLYVRNCDICKSAKPTNQIQRAEMGKQRVATRPWQILQIDFIGPLPRSKSGYLYILVVVDTFTKFVHVSPLRVATTKTTCRVLEDHVFLVFGVPEIIISDNGSQFIAKEFKKFLEEYSVKHWLTAPYHPQANAAEAANKTIGIAIRAYLKDQKDHRNWDVNLKKIACAMNSSIHTSTKCSPYFANFGQQIITSGKTYKNLITNDVNISDSNCNFKELRKSILENLEKTYRDSKKRYDLRARPIQYHVGDTVWKENFVQSDASKFITAKFAPKFIKCVVKKRIGSNMYDLEDEQGNVYKSMSASNIKK